LIRRMPLWGRTLGPLPGISCEVLVTTCVVPN
jgi:hypothetical protein